MTQSIRQDLIQRAIGSQQQPQAQPIDDESVVAPQAIRNDLVQQAIAQPRSQVTMKQRAMIGLIKEDPELQKRFLDRQGFETRIQDGVVQVKQGKQFVPANPEGFDLGDIVEYLPEVVEGVAGAVATGTKVMGALGAPVTGGASIPAAMGIGGAVTGAVETGKQALAAGLGLREDIDPGRIARQTAIGAAVPGIVGGAGSAFKSAKRGLGRAIFGEVAEEAVDVAGIKAAGKAIGAKPTPGMLTTDPGIRMTESVLSKQTLGVGGAFLRKQQKVNEAAAIRTAEEILESKSARSAFEVGEAFKEKVMKSIGKKLKPAEDLYSEVAERIPNIKADKTKIEFALDNMQQKFKFSDQALNFIENTRNKLDQLVSVEDLKLFRTSIIDDIPRDAPKNMKLLADELYDAATRARSDSFTKGVRNLKGQFQKAEAQSLLGKIKEADQIYRETAKDVQKALLKPGAQIKKGVKREAAEALEKVVPEKRLQRFLPGQDVQRAAALERLSKEGFDELASSRIAEIADKSVSAARGRFGALNPQAVAREIDKLSPEIATKMFGKDGVAKAKALQKFYRAIPGDINPSGTATTLDILAFPFRQVSSASLSAVNAFLRFKGDVTKAPLFTGISAMIDQSGKEGK
ncbi:hypothetical protein CMI37_20815 [Candidatus Pacearchaeota archaeon]|nr:hypothetical protein [Candidatus Pacearchaeota archaeon]|tara:strand:+ start:264 stop:2159 length:1896 start_codon:yes stop_codon:yes gene_type:complete